MKILLTQVLIVLLCLSCQPAQKQAEPDWKVTETVRVNGLSIEWLLQTRNAELDDMLIPRTAINIKINGKTFHILEDAQGDYYQLDAEEMQSWDIPGSASSAILGGFAGLFRCVYVEQQHDTLNIIQAWSDAESEIHGWMDIETIKIISTDNFIHP